MEMENVTFNIPDQAIYK